MTAMYVTLLYVLSFPNNPMRTEALSVSPIAILGIFLLSVWLNYRQIIIVPRYFPYEFTRALLLPIWLILSIVVHKLYVSWYPTQSMEHTFINIVSGLSCVLSPFLFLSLWIGSCFARVVHYSNWTLALAIAEIARTEAVPLNQKTRGFLLWLIRDIWQYPSLGYETFWSVSSLLRVPFRRRGLRRLYGLIGRMFQFTRRAFAAMFRRLPR